MSGKLGKLGQQPISMLDLKLFKKPSVEGMAHIDTFCHDITHRLFKTNLGGGWDELGDLIETV